MSRVSQPPLNPDDLNDLWDAAVEGPLETGKLAGTPEATIIGWLQAAAPEPEPARSHLNPPIAGTTMSANSNQARNWNRRRPSWQPLASGFLAVALVVAILFAKPVRDLWQPELQRGFGSPTDDASNFAPGTGRNLMSIVVRPGEVEAGTVQVGFWDVTVPPGMALHVPAGIQVMGNQAMAGWVESGTIVVGSQGFEHEIQAGHSTAVEPAPEYLRNEGAMDARLLLLVPMEAADVFPLRPSAWPAPHDATATPVGDRLPASRMFDAVTLNSKGAFQYRVSVMVSTFEPGMQFVELAPAGRGQESIHSTTVLRGELMHVNEPGAGTPGVVEVLREGDTIQADPDDPMLQASSSGEEDLTLLSLTSTPWSENPTLDQTVAPVAPFWGEWMVPVSGEVSLAVRSLAIEPGGGYGLPTDAGVMYYLAEGELSATNEGPNDTGTLLPGSVVAQMPGAVLALTNASESPAQLIQVLTFAGTLDAAVAQEQVERVDAVVLVEASGSMPPGLASLMLQANEYDGVNDGGSSGSGGNGLTLLSSIDGTVQVRREGGNATVLTGLGEDPYQPALGEGVEIAEGDAVIVQPGGGWAITGADGEPGTGIILSVSPVVDNLATLAASPAASQDATILLKADPASCDESPVTSTDVEILMATPGAIGDPLARSARDLEGNAADPETAAKIVAAMQAYADCWSTGNYALAANVMSDQAIRESESMREFIATDFQAGEIPHLTFAIEDIVSYPDGRAGARVVMNGEAAYVTFAVQNGQWVIDVWDDRDGGPPINAPQSG